MLKYRFGLALSLVLFAFGLLFGQTETALASATQAKPLRTSGIVMQTKLVQAPPLKYPKGALKKKIEGEVKLDIVIGAYGSVKSVKVTDGPKELTKATADAVKHWRYQPTVLNGKAVEVETTVDLNFKMSAPESGQSAKEAVNIHSSSAEFSRTQMEMIDGQLSQAALIHHSCLSIR